MKKFFSVLTILGFVSIATIQSSEAFSWSNLNPAYWGHCPRCEKKKIDCECPSKSKECEQIKRCNPCQSEISPCTGAAAPVKCNPCKKQINKPTSCDACDKLQQMNK